MRQIVINLEKKTAVAYDNDPPKLDHVFFIVDEGKLGVWLGFSSADREYIAGELPFQENDDFIGNGDPDFFLTANVPNGQVIQATPSVNGNWTHPLYQEWLDAHDND